MRNKSRTKDKKKSEAFTQKEIDDKLAIVRAMHMKERQTCSHLFNLESWLRSSCSMRRVVDLEEDLRSNGGTKTLLDQLLDASPEWLKQFPSGLAELKRLNSPTLSGCINIVDLLNCIVNEKRMKRESCPLCKANPPRAPTFARHVSIVHHMPLGITTNTNNSVVTSIASSVS